MFDHRFRAACGLLWLCVVTATTADAAGPRAGFKLNAEHTVTSPDQTLRVEQYSKELKDQGVLYQFWTFDRDRRHPFLVNPGEGDDLAGYAAGFRFTRDSQWLVRMQKLGAGYQTLFLYRRQVSFFTRDDQAPWRSGLGLFLQPAGRKRDATGPERPLFAPSRG